MEVNFSWEELFTFLKNSCLETLDEKDNKIFQLCLFIVENKEELLATTDLEIKKFASLLFGLTTNVIINASNQFCENELLLWSTIEVIVSFCVSNLKSGLNNSYITQLQLVKLLVGISTCKESLNKDEINALLNMEFVFPAFLKMEAKTHSDLLYKSLFNIDLNKLRSSDWKVQFMGHAAAILRKKNVFDILLNVIGSFEELDSFARKCDLIFYDDSNPQSISAISILSFETQLMVIVETLKLPIIDQMTKEQLELVIQLVDKSLKAAMFISSGYFTVNKKENEADGSYDDYCRKYEWKSTEHCLAILSAVSNICSSSPHMERFVGFNLEAKSVTTILNVLQRAIKKEHEHKSKWFDGLNISLVTMTSRVILLLSSVYDNIQLEGDYTLQNQGLNVFVKSTACDRLRYIIENVHLPSLLLDLFLTTYHKTLNNLMKQNENLKIDQSELKVESLSDEDSLEEGSMLGSFFVKTINDNEAESSVTVKENERNASSQSTEILVLLASSLIEFISKFFPVCVENGFREKIKESFTDERLDGLAKIIMGHSFGGSFEVREIKENISKLFGYFVTTGLFQETQMNLLLKTLGISVQKESSNRQLNLSIHVLRIFIQLVLLDTSGDSGINSWKCLISTLVDSAENGSKEYLNVQHAQAMIMVLQLLSKDKKEIIFSEIIQALGRLSTLNIKNAIHVAHLILLFDYMIHLGYSTKSTDLIAQVQHNILSADIDKPSYVKSFFKEEDELKSDTIVFYGLIEQDKIDTEVLTFLKNTPDYSQWYSSILTLLAQMINKFAGGELLDRLGARNASLYIWNWLPELPIAIEWINNIFNLDAEKSSFEEYLFYICWMPSTFEMTAEQIKSNLMVQSSFDTIVSERKLFADDISSSIDYFGRIISLLSNLLNSTHLLKFSPYAISDSIVNFAGFLVDQYMMHKKVELLKYAKEFRNFIEQMMLLLNLAVRKAKEMIIKLATADKYTTLDNEVLEFYIDIIGLDLPTVNSKASDLKRIQVLPERFCQYIQDWQGLNVQRDDLQENKDFSVTSLVRYSLITHLNIQKESKSELANGFSLKNLIYSLSNVCNKVLHWMNTSMNEEFQTLKHLGISLYSGFWCDSFLKNISHHSEKILNLCLGETDQDQLEKSAFIRILEIIDKWYMKELSRERILDEGILIGWLEFLMDLIEHSKTLVIFLQYFANKPSTLFSIFKSIANHTEFSNNYLTAFVQFFSKFFLIKEKLDDGIHRVLFKIFDEDYEVLYNWMKRVSTSVEGCILLQSFINIAVQNSQSVDKALPVLLDISEITVSLVFENKLSGTTSFPLLFEISNVVARSCGGQGYVQLLKKVINWLSLSLITDKNNKQASECILKIVLYITDIITSSCIDDVSDDTLYEFTPDLNKRSEECNEEASVYESIEGNTCTFSVTQRDFMNQHWYHCHTCKMNDGIGCCTVCAKICHKDHDVTYAKHGSFFCDCGAKEDGSCKAMSGSSKFLNRVTSHPSTWGPSKLVDKKFSKAQNQKSIKSENNLQKILQDSKLDILSVVNNSSLLDSFIQLLLENCKVFTKEVEEAVCEMRSQKHKLKEKLEILYTSEKEFSIDNIMNAVSGSQEGAFENIKLTYGGEQGATLRQLINAHMIHHKAMCLIVSPFGKRQFLAVAHEKGKVTILQLSGLLRLPESNQKKMTLNRLSSTVVPFTVLHMVSNPLNDEFLAVTGLKDCLVLILGNSASTPTRLTLNIKLDTGNFIIKALWVPGSQTQLALLTADFIKIFDLSVSETDPIYYFVVPSGKIRDATFVPDDKQNNIVIMSSQGYIYVEALNDASKQCLFYTMNVVNVQHPNKEESDQSLVNGGGVSVYYSQTLKLLFFSYNKGLSFFGCLDQSLLSFTKLFLIDNPITLSSPLVQWSEVPGQVGLLHCTLQNSGNIVMLAVKPEKVIIQEIKSVAKSVKVLNAVCHHHSTIEGHAQSVTECTTLIVLLDDGSLRIYNANQDIIQFSKPPENLFMNTHFTERLVNKEKKQDNKKSPEKFPVDFFETCHLTNDVEFGGEHILHIYNKNQVKNRLNTTGMYIANTKPFGFKIEILNTNPSNVIVGIRLQVGVQSMERSPQYIDVFGRIIYLRSVKNRWFDIPFTREESNICLEKNMFTVTFGPSTDPYGVSIVDSIKVYTKTKEEFSAVEESTETAVAESSPSLQEPQISKYQSSQSEMLLFSLLSAINKLLKIVDGSKISTVFDTLLNISTQLLTVDPQLKEVSAIGYQTHMLLKNLYPGDGKYQNKKDEVLVSHMMKLFETTQDNLDLDVFEMILNIGSFVGETQADNLVKFVEISGGKQADKFAESLVKKFWKLYENCCSSSNYQESWHMEANVELLVGIIFSIMLGDAKFINSMCQLIFELLLAKDQTISFAAKKGLTKSLLLRQTHVKQSESNDSNPSATESKNEDLSSYPPLEKSETTNKSVEPSTPVSADNLDEDNEEDDIEDMDMMDDEGDIDDGDLQMLIDDDNAMMEIALALSLQNDEENNDETQQENKNIAETSTSEQGFEGNVAQDNNIEELHSDQVDGQGFISESPNYIEGPNLLEGGSLGIKFSALWSQLLEIFEAKIPYLLELDGLQAIPFLQVMLMLCSNLMVERDEDKAALRRIIVACINPLHVKLQTDSNAPIRTTSSEVQLVLMRFLSVLMSRCNANKQVNEGENVVNMSSSFDAYVAGVLQEQGLVEYCLCLLKSLLSYWKSQSSTEEDNTTETTLLLKAKALHPTPDMMPFFMEQYVKSHAVDLFESFSQLVSEMVLRMPYQIHKLIDSNTREICFSKDWVFIMCEYMMISHAPFVRRQVRKLLLALCGTKEKYRFVKDLHNIRSRLACLKSVLQMTGTTGNESITKNISLSYEETVTLTEQISACIDIATARNENWLLFCKKESILPFLMEISYQLDEHISSKVVELIFIALSSPQNKDDKKENKSKSLSVELVKLVFSRCYGTTIFLFIKSFLLESNSSQLRWKVHSLVHSIFINIDAEQQVGLTELMWTLWNVIPSCGHRATQFTDLLGFFTIKTMRCNVNNYVTMAMSLLHEANSVLMNHPNASLYRKLCNSVELEGYYLESDPCAVCNNPEVAFNSYKLSTIKSDIRHTPKSQLIKLTTNHTISKIVLKISDIKKAKMVKSMIIFYNNKPVPSVVELKKSGIWQKAKKVFLTQGQTDVKVEFAFPITACNLMIEFSSFYENVQFSAESLQCPRCSASVPAHPGICGNCGENVYQCHKCRAINYDERDPFLCTLCGFCKYAKFDFVLSAHSSCTVDTINNEEERQKALKAVNSALEKADQYYQALTGHRQMLESILRTSSDGAHSAEEELPTDKSLVWNVSPLSTNSQTTSTASVAITSIRRSIQSVAQLYCVDCKTSFDNMSKATQTVTALRKELLQYDMKQQEALSQAMYLTPEILPSPSYLDDKPQFYRLPSFSGVPEEVYILDKQGENLPRVGKCYGCALSTVHHCLTVLRALSTIESAHECLLMQGCLQELVTHNLQLEKKDLVALARTLLIKLTSENKKANESLNELICERIKLCLSVQSANMMSNISLSSELSLLRQSVASNDFLWEQRLSCVFMLLLDSLKNPSTEVRESITLPCLEIINSCVKPKLPSNKKIIRINKPNQMVPIIDFEKWLRGDYTYLNWKESKSVGSNEPEQHFERKHNGWLKQLLFASSSRATRQTICSILEQITLQSSQRKEILLQLLMSYLSELRLAGENSSEYLALLKKILSGSGYKVYMSNSGIMDKLCQLIVQEVEHLASLERTTLNVDLTQGYSLFALAELFKSFLEDAEVKNVCQQKYVADVLQCYLSLRKLVVQRTKLVDQTQDILLALLEQLNSGTEDKFFMKTCIDALKRCPINDIRTPIFIFEQLCNTIYKPEVESTEFFMNLEKDPQQEDFLQGRMHGNPYSSNQPGLGPLMRDIKNTICTECELVALLEDDTGMELLVNNKIISLDLPVLQVYKKVWCSRDDHKDPMRIVYRMRGLLGDATEDIIENLSKEKADNVDEESQYQRASIIAEISGLENIFKRLSYVRDLSRAQHLVAIILKLLEYCIKVKVNRQYIIQPSLCGMKILLSTLNHALRLERDYGSKSGGAMLAERVLKIMEVVLHEATIQGDLQQIDLPDEESQLELLLNHITSPYVRSNANVLQAMMKLTPFLTFGNEESMLSLIEHFLPYLDFDKFDNEKSADSILQLDCLCMIAEGISKSDTGSKLKDLMIREGIVTKALDYLQNHTPPQSFRASGILDSAKWKEFIAKPSLPYILRLLTGLLHNHQNTQILISTNENVAVIHHLEQISSEEMVGSLAENLLEALCLFPEGKIKVAEIRNKTRDEKKALAMAMRQKQLDSLGMTVTGSGQIKTMSPSSQEMAQLLEEQDQRVVCSICREGYKFYPNKVLGVYTFTSRCILDDYENKTKKTQGYSTVSHFNIIHFDCHIEAVRHARSRDEWESAALQNANTKCNGLLPLWGPEVSESAFASCLARHNNYIQECTGLREPTFHSNVHDIRLMLLKFAHQKSFSHDAGGGGKHSNMYLIPYMVNLALYVVNSTHQRSNEEQWLNSFLDASIDNWVGSCYELNGPMFACVLSLFIMTLDSWKSKRIIFLKRLMVLAHARDLSNIHTNKLMCIEPSAFSVYKPYLVFFSLIDRLHNLCKSKISITDDWSQAMSSYLRNNDEQILKECDNIIKFYEEDILLCESFAEYCDVAGLLSEMVVPPDQFIRDLLVQFLPVEEKTNVVYC
ncbi:E3 ubiquitin-protein ligase UBR4 isoform X2 [Hydra vulgaris]|uniref:E3 ubiquitin-protein ligase UBR4 isoform X2 n=1 Tax=Hydra vulgaris TaxID=6087 RepID=UPI001F5E7EBC|nr:E3 ubiquitin-protein ligase UBR4 isoform X2 [Hydra vulgaris]